MLLTAKERKRTHYAGFLKPEDVAKTVPELQNDASWLRRVAGKSRSKDAGDLRRRAAAMEELADLREE